MVNDKEDWQYTLSARVLQWAIKDLANAWSKFFNCKQSESKTKKSKVGKPSSKIRKIQDKDSKLIELVSKTENLF